MTTMMRESWTDERLDDLKEQMNQRFEQVDTELREIRRLMFQGFVASVTISVTTTVTCFAALAGLMVL